MQSISTAGNPKPKLSRAERNYEVKRRLFDAAAKIVGRLGYAEASVARITELGQDLPSREQQTPQALGARHRADIEKWWPLIKAANIKAD